MSNGFQKFISGKGFYLALAVCLAGAGAAAWVAVDKTIENIEQPPLAQTPQTEQQESFSQPAEQKVENIQKEESAEKELPSAEADIPTEDSSEDVLSPSVKPEASIEEPESLDTSSQPAKQLPSSDFAFNMPLNGAAIAEFSGDMLVKNETLGDWRTHNGIDLGASVGTEVTSACDGVVTSVSTDPLWGNVVEVRSGDYLVTYAGLGDDIAVAEEMAVAAGEVIGSVGEIPCELSLEPHLHLDVKLSGKYVDPASLAE